MSDRRSMPARYTYAATPEWDTPAVKRYIVLRDGDEVASVTVVRDVPFHGSILTDICRSFAEHEADAGRLDLSSA